MTVRVRFAPSPTGQLHIGSARTALFNYLFSKKHKGAYILRIEDTDIERNITDAEGKLIQELKWLGLFWDEGPDVGGEYGPYRSMERLPIYKKYLQQLLDEGKAYRCYCTKEELEKEKEHMIKRGEVPRYSGKCRGIEKKEDIPFTIRFKVPKGESVEFDDLVREKVHFSSDDVEDFVICKSNGVPTYHFAVSVDDALMKITHVIRGEEHLSNTPKHLLLFEALGSPPPQFAHIPLILNESGKKLSKRDESVLQFIKQYRDLGYLPEAVDNYLALLGWSPTGEYVEEEVFSMEKLEELFSLERINRSGAIFDPGKLAWMNSQYIKAMDVDNLVQMTIPYFHREVSQDVPESYIRDLVHLFQSGMDAVSDIIPLSNLFFQKEVSVSTEGYDVLKSESSKVVLTSFLEKVLNVTDMTKDDLKPLFKEVQKETGYKGKQLFMPIRVAVTGEVQGPDLKETLCLLGKEKVSSRIKDAIDSDC